LSTCYSHQKDDQTNPGSLPKTDTLSENGEHWMTAIFIVFVLKELIESEVLADDLAVSINKH
jgi:hypothetical protein